MKPYADTNFLCRLYLPMPESGEAARRLAMAQAAGVSPLPVSWLHRLETINAFQLYAFTSNTQRQTRVTAEQVAASQAMFQSDLAQPTFLRPAHLNLADLEAQFEDLALRHTAKHGFRTYDLLHVASALLLKCDTLWSFDQKAAKLGRLEGLIEQ